MVQITPCSWNSRVTVAPEITPSSNELPTPDIAGGFTDGPSVSRHTTSSERSPLAWLTVHRNATRPRATDSEPYLAALVASSWNTRPNGVARSAGRATGSPDGVN